jgi:hypothetical protein
MNASHVQEVDSETMKYMQNFEEDSKAANFKLSLLDNLSVSVL